MDSQMHEKVSLYLKNQLAQADARLKAYTIGPDNKPYLKRSAALVLEKYIRNYSQFRKEPRWIAVPGLRGVGKTTLLAQLYSELQCGPNYKLYISLDEAKRVLGVSLTDILIVYEEILGKVFENLDNPIYLFIDEVQYEPDWGLILKSLYDRTNKIFIFCTGSSALSLQKNPDVSRRIVFDKLYPMSFTEYRILKVRQFPIVGIGKKIRETLLQSKNAEEVYKGLLHYQIDINNYWSKIDRLEIDKYLKYGTLPFTLQYTKEPLIYEQIEQTLTNIQTKDIPQVSKFDQSTINKMVQILYAVASSDITSLNTYSSNFSMSINTITDIFDVFEKSEVLLRIFPHGSHFGQTKKPSKYLFLSPAYRSMFFNLIGSTYSYDHYKGKLLEDAVGLYLYRILGLRFGSSLTYDSSSGGTDFIVGYDGKKIMIEVGYGEKGFTQVEKSLNIIGGSYGLSISPSRLKLNDKKNALTIPISFFLLI